MFRSRRWIWALLPVVAAGLAGAWWFSTRPTPYERFEAGLAALDRGDLSEARHIAEDLRGVEGMQNHARVLHAGAFVIRQKPVEALTMLAGAALNENSGGVLKREQLRYAGRAYHALGRLVEAETYFGAMLQNDADDPEAHRWLAIVYYDLGAMSQAESHLNRLAELAPDDWRPRRLLGLILSDFAQYETAVAHYEAALKLQPPPDVADAVAVELAKSLLNLRRYDEALELLSRSTETAETLALQADVRFGQGQLEDAAQWAERALQADPGQTRALSVRSKLALAEGRPEQALAPLERILADDPHEVETRYQLALVYRRLNRLDDYEREIARKDASHALFTKMSELSQKAIQNPHDPEVRDELAHICEQLGKDKLADTWRNAAAACRDRLRNAS